MYIKRAINVRTLRRRVMLSKRRKRRHTKNVISSYLNLALLYMRVRRQPNYVRMLICAQVCIFQYCIVDVFAQNITVLCPMHAIKIYST